jgi:4'-phosphopantetheinyl transferase EntD
LLAGLFAETVIAVETRARFEARTLHADEAGYVSRAVPKRVSEFAAGRACARVALAQLGIAEFALRVGPDREPVWPADVTGSITHTGAYCGVVVAPQSRLQSLGIDAEVRGAVHRRLWPHIGTAQELVWLEGLAEPQALTLASLLFSAKEAFFKCQYYLTRRWLNFSDVSVSVDDSCFSIRPCGELQLAALPPPPWQGRHARAGELIVTGIGLPHRVAPAEA